MTSLRYLLVSAWENLTQNRLMSIVSISSIALALMVSGGVLLLQYNSSRLMNELKSQTSVVAFLESQVSQSRRKDLESKLISNPKIADVEFRSEDVAMSIMKNRLGEDLVSGLGRNPFPASFHISLEPDQLDQIDAIASTISQWSGISDVDYGKKHVERLQNVSQIVSILLGSIGLIICVVSVFVIFNTIQLTVMSREDEIDILKLVGATRWFISTPFILSGAAQGVMGCFLGTGFLWVLYVMIRARVRTLEFFPLDPAFLGLWRGGLLLLLGFFLGVIGSATAVYRTVRRM